MGVVGMNCAWLNPPIQSYLRGHTLILFRDNFFPKEPYNVMGKGVELGKMYSIGPWHVIAQPVNRKPNTNQVAYEHVLSGSFSYDLPLADSYFFSSRNIPGFPRGEDSIFVSSLPLVCACSAQSETSSSDTCTTVSVQWHQQYTTIDMDDCVM